MNSHNKKYHVTLNDVVQVVFIILKLCKLIDWSWWVVLIPTWVTLGVFTIRGIVFAGKYEAISRTKEQK